MHDHSTPLPCLPSCSLSGMMVAILGFTLHIRVDPAGGFFFGHVLPVMKRMKMSSSGRRSGRPQEVRKMGCFASAMLQATACSARLHMTKDLF